MYWKYEDNWECARIYENVRNDLGNVLDYIRTYVSDLESTGTIRNVLKVIRMTLKVRE